MNAQATQGAAVLLSGGLDSAVLLVETRRRYCPVHPLYISSGLAWESAEQFWLEKFLEQVNQPGVEPLRVLELPVTDLYPSHWSVTGKMVPDAHSPDQAVYVPGRNLLLIAKAAIYCSMADLHVIALGTLQGNPFADSTAEFFHAYERLLADALNCPIRIETPFRRQTKRDVIRLGKSLPLELTFSCIDPAGYTHCGRCNKCQERRLAFARAGLDDPTEYAAVAQR